MEKKDIDDTTCPYTQNLAQEILNYSYAFDLGYNEMVQAAKLAVAIKREEVKQ